MNKEQVLVWKTQQGNLVRLSHMSNEHLKNAIEWLLLEPESVRERTDLVFSDLTELYEGVMIGTWIQAMTAELYDRTAMPVG